MDLDRYLLLGFEKRLVARIHPIQLERLQHTQDSLEENERHALGMALIGCGSLWGLFGIPIFFASLALQWTVGLWCLPGYAGFVGCLGMAIWRRQQFRRLFAGWAVRKKRASPP